MWNSYARLKAAISLTIPKGTNVGAVAAAVCGLAAQGRRILILMGGDGKGQDFTPLAKELKGRVAFAALIGRDAAKIREAVSPAGVATETFKDA